MTPQRARPVPFSTWLRQKIHQGNSSLREVAREIGLPPNALSRWRAGQVSPNPGVLLLLANFFGEDPALLFRLAGKTELEAVYRPIFPNQPPRRLSESDLYKNPKHASLHFRVQKLLQRGFAESLEEWLAEQEPLDYLNFRLSEAVRLTKSERGILFMEMRDTAGTWREGFLLGVAPWSGAVVPDLKIDGRHVDLDWVKTPPGGWRRFERAEEREEGGIVIYLLLEKPRLGAHLKTLLNTYLEDWAAAAWEGPSVMDTL